MEDKKSLANSSDPWAGLFESLKILNLLPVSGNGKIELIFQDNALLDITKTVRERVKVSISS